MNDDGCIVELADSVIIRDNLPDGEITDLLAYNKELFYKSMAEGNFDQLIQPPKLNGPPRYVRNNQSQPIPIVGGEYIPIKIKYLHSVFNSLFESGTA